MLDLEKYVTIREGARIAELPYSTFLSRVRAAEVKTREVLGHHLIAREIVLQMKENPPKQGRPKKITVNFANPIDV